MFALFARLGYNICRNTYILESEMKTAFIGHRQIFGKTIAKRLEEAIKTEIENGCKFFTMGTHGEFDDLALSVCRNLRNQYKDIKIEVVITGFRAIKKSCGYEPYSDVKTVMYNIEDAHYKQKITLSNRQMIDTCDTLICYVNKKQYRSGAKTAMYYAKRKGLRIINLYREEDQPFYGMTEEEISAYEKELFSAIEKHKS